jgi:septum site-determining protein MinC
MAEYSGEEASKPRSLSETDRLKKEEKQSVSVYVSIKGTRSGLRLRLEPETPFSELLNALADRLAESPSFFRGASLAVDTSHRALRTSERMQLEDLLALYQMSVTSTDSGPLGSGTDHTHDQRSDTPTGSGRDRHTTLPLHQPDPPQRGAITQDMGHVPRDARESEDTLFLRRTIRSGQAIHHPSNVVVLGDVNPGAEIVAGGDIIVWGVLRGMVHAGYPDNENALVCSLQLAPVQLRIAHLLSRPPEGFEAQPRPEIATIRQGQIVVETWMSGRPSRR